LSGEKRRYKNNASGRFEREKDRPDEMRKKKKKKRTKKKRKKKPKLSTHPSIFARGFGRP
jgi:hypothetical protein